MNSDALANYFKPILYKFHDREALVYKTGFRCCRSHVSPTKPPKRQMLGCGPDACSVEVCLNAGRISAGKRANQDGEGLDGERSAIMQSEFPSNPSPS